jgi:hypothetical protein
MEFEYDFGNPFPKYEEIDESVEIISNQLPENYELVKKEYENPKDKLVEYNPEKNLFGDILGEEYEVRADGEEVGLIIFNRWDDPKKISSIEAQLDGETQAIARTNRALNDAVERLEEESSKRTQTSERKRRRGTAERLLGQR